MKLNNQTYDVLKFIAMIVLPAVAALYSGLGALWGIPATEQVVGSIVLVDTFLGALLQIKTAQYNNSDASHDGYVTSTGRNEDTNLADLQFTLTKHPDEILRKKTVRLKVQGPKHAKAA